MTTIQDIKETSRCTPSGPSKAEPHAMSADERRKMVAQWLTTWLKEGDTRLAVN